MALMYSAFDFLKLNFFSTSFVKNIAVWDFYLKDWASFTHVGPFSMWAAPLHAVFRDSLSNPLHCWTLIVWEG